jgi:hypothetical protein
VPSRYSEVQLRGKMESRNLADAPGDGLAPAGNGVPWWSAPLVVRCGRRTAKVPEIVANVGGASRPNQPCPHSSPSRLAAWPLFSPLGAAFGWIL